MLAIENPVSKLIEERLDLPVFYIEDKKGSSLIVNLGDRRKIELQIFLENFISNSIQFKKVVKSQTIQTVRLRFYEMSCWKCQELNQFRGEE